LYDTTTADRLRRIIRNAFAAAVEIGDATCAAHLTLGVEDELPATLRVREPVTNDAVTAGLTIRVHRLAVAAVVARRNDDAVAAAQVVIRIVGGLLATTRV